MVREVTQWADSSGKVHPTFQDALIADIALTIGQKGDGPEGQPNVAKIIAEKAKDLMPLLEQCIHGQHGRPE